MPLLTPALLDTRPTDGAVAVAFSGGLDSTALLHALASSSDIKRGGLRALHVHHGLHQDADAWALHCQAFCDGLGVPLRVLRVEVARGGGHGLEAAARRERHGALEAELQHGETLALAHHQDDQAETFLLRALRASGPDGLGAMQHWRHFGRGGLWRPLLDLPRPRLLAYARRHGLTWIDDPSNADVAFDRNFLRQRILPLLHERWPHASASFARSAGLCAEATALLAPGDARAFAQVATADPHAVSRIALARQPQARRARVLRHWVASLGLPPLPAQGVAQVEVQLLRADGDAEAAFAWGGAIVRGWRDLLHADWQHAPLPVDLRLEWDGTAPLALPGGARLQLDGATAFDCALVVHARRGGERITLPGRTHSHALKHVLQDLGIPPWVRAGMPLLSERHGELLAAGDLALSARFDRWLREHGARLAWVTD